MPIATLCDLFRATIGDHRRDDAFGEKRNGRWERVSSDEFAMDVAAVGEALVGLGMVVGDRVAILSENRYAWAVADFATITRGGITVPVYPTLPPGQVAAILRDSGAKWIFASTDEQVRKVFEIGGGLKDLSAIIAIDPVDVATRQVLTLDDVRSQGKAALEKSGQKPLDTVVTSEPDDLATIIYTSGTTGEPKGVMLSHFNIVSNVRAALDVIPITGEDSFLSFLPLSHVFERMAGYYTPLSVGAPIYYAESIDTVALDATEIKPTIMLGVPRFFEKFHARVTSTIDAAPKIRQRLFGWATGLGREATELAFAGKTLSGAKSAQLKLASALVFKKLKSRIGGRLRFFVSGSAPLRGDLIMFFNSLGIPIYEGYGLTETSPVVAVNTPEAIRVGSVGRALPGVDVRIADDGEILVKGPNVTLGYFRNPDATREIFTEDDWFMTGDIGKFDEDGFLFITDRKKDLLKTAGGKFVAPQPIEGRLRQSKIIADAMVIGDERKFVSAIIVPDFDALESHAIAQGIDISDRESLLERGPVRELFEVEINAANEGLARHETIKKFLLVPDELTIADGALTPTMKLKRRVIEERFRSRIDALYIES